MARFAGTFFAVAAIAAFAAHMPPSYVLATAGLAFVAYALRAKDSIQR